MTKAEEKLNDMYDEYLENNYRKENSEMKREKIKEIFDKELKYNDGWKLVAAIQTYNYADVIAIVNSDDANAFFNEEIKNNTLKESFDILNEILVEDFGIKND